jgi:hypothetical protein
VPRAHAALRQRVMRVSSMRKRRAKKGRAPTQCMMAIERDVDTRWLECVPSAMHDVSNARLRSALSSSVIASVRRTGSQRPGVLVAMRLSRRGGRRPS